MKPYDPRPSCHWGSFSHAFRGARLGDTAVIANRLHVLVEAELPPEQARHRNVLERLGAHFGHWRPLETNSG